MTIEVAVLVLLSGSKERKRRHNENMFKTKVIYNQEEKSFFLQHGGNFVSEYCCFCLCLSYITFVKQHLTEAW